MLKQKVAGKRRKLYHFSNLIIDFQFTDIDYGLASEDKETWFTGSLYVLDNPDMDVLHQVISNYDNTKIVTRYNRYAPELKNVCLFITK